jgi:hypothetical protein
LPAIAPAARAFLTQRVPQYWLSLFNTCVEGQAADSTTSFWARLERDPVERSLFAGFMAETSVLGTPAVVAALDLSWARVVVDMGGGVGAMTEALLARYPTMRGIVFELPNVVAEGRAYWRGRANADRVEFVAGSFLDAEPKLPSEADVYLFRGVLHDWDDAAVVQILRGARAAMGPRSQVVVADPFLHDDDRNEIRRLLSVEMLNNCTGREREVPEFEVLLRRAGLRMTKFITTATPISVLTAVAAD